MNSVSDTTGLELIANELEGELFYDQTHRLLYSTDASAYKEKPLAVAYPRNANDIFKLIILAGRNNITLIPRGAGTSLAGQVVGGGIVVDVSKHLNGILEINTDERWVRVQPGVVLDELNLHIRKHGLFFAPETSTSNRCVTGGMVGNNSAGLHSLIYGTTREHLISVSGYLGDGSFVEFREVSKAEFYDKCTLLTTEGSLYRHISGLLSDADNIKLIDDEFPDRLVVRRNTGYALDELSDCEIFRKSSGKKFNFAKLIAGSEGTLMFITEMKLNLVPLPPPVTALICVHCNTVNEAIRGNLVALKFKPSAVELMDNKILELTKENIEQRKNRFFVKGDPGALLIIEFTRDSIAEINSIATELENEMRSAGTGYHFPVLTGTDCGKAWNLRKAGLGVLSNITGDAKPVSVIEDTSVEPSKLEGYINEFNELISKAGLDCVYHAHISVGELHLRPILNLKDEKDIRLFRYLAKETALLVKKYRGSLSGEHGDGRLRGEFIPIMVGERIYEWFRDLKNTWDPHGILNKGKIVETPAMDSHLRYLPGQETREIPTIFNFDAEGGILRSVEKCNGSGDCRKPELMAGVMCPSYRATLNETETTRARANLLREFLTNSPKDNPFDHKELYSILDLCISCKGCKSECPSNIDMAKFKAEFLQHYYDANGTSLRTKLIANIDVVHRIGSLVPGLYNYFARNIFFSGLLKKSLGFSPKRNIPLLSGRTVMKWVRKNLKELNSLQQPGARKVLLFVDEFINYQDSETGIAAIRLLSRLGYHIEICPFIVCGRAYISKGFLRKARKIAIDNITAIAGMPEELPLIGIEPSAVLSFKDEYPELVRGELVQHALKISANSFLIDEFLANEIDAGRVRKEQFTSDKRNIKLHGHCQQKAISSTSFTRKILSLPENYTVTEIPSGCCGMAGSFGYEEEHYEISMKIGEMTLFPQIRRSPSETIIAAPGISCREQINAGTGITARHPVVILFEALI